MNSPIVRVMHGPTIEMVGCFTIDLKEIMIITLLESKMMKGDQESILGISFTRLLRKCCTKIVVELNGHKGLEKKLA